jgi:hypothetical protein
LKVITVAVTGTATVYRSYWPKGGAC